MDSHDAYCKKLLQFYTEAENLKIKTVLDQLGVIGVKNVSYKMPLSYQPMIIVNRYIDVRSKTTQK